MSAKYIMKGDDDTFLKVDAILNEASNVPDDIGFYIGNMNYHHKPLRHGKWAVTYEVIRTCCDVLFPRIKERDLSWKK